MRLRFHATPTVLATASSGNDSTVVEKTTSHELRSSNDAEASVGHGPESKEVGVSTNVHQDDTDSTDEAVTKEFQHGVQAAQAMTQVWERKHLVAAYIL